MIRKSTIAKIILNFEGKFSAKDIYLKNMILFSQSYNKKKSLNYITVILHILWKENKIKKVERGIFTNDESYIQVDFNNWGSVIKFYCENDNGFVAQEWLWNKHGFLNEFPKKLVIYSNLVKRAKKHGNIEIKPTKIPINSETRKIFELYELVQIADFRNESHYLKIKLFIKENKLKLEQIKSYNQFFKRRYVKLMKNYKF